MLSAGWMKACAFSGMLAVVAMATTPSEAASGCATLSASTIRFPASAYTLGPFTVSLNAGDVVKLTDPVVGATDTLNVGSSTQSFGTPGSTSITIPSNGTYTVSASGTTFPPGGTADLSAVLSCTPASTGGGGQQLINQQLSNNAQTAIANGTRTLQNYLEWVTKGVQGSFGMTRGGDIASMPRNTEPSAQAMAEKLAREERDLTEQLRALPADDDRARELNRRLMATRRDLSFARVTADLGAADGSPRRTTSRGALPDDTGLGETATLHEQPGTRVAVPQSMSVRAATLPNDGPIDGAARTAATPSVTLDACDLPDACEADGRRDVMGRKWNTWVEGRVVGATDSLAQTNALGFAGIAGVDYKFQPWLAVGMSVGVETTETRFGQSGVRTGTFGVSLTPYVGMRLADNVYAEAFIGLTKLNYNTNPIASIAGNFDALRFFFGGSVSGVWYDGAWRFQPSISGAYGTESQNGYTDSAGNAVHGQTVSYGRITAGPEVGYIFKNENRNWSLEPFVMVKAAVDFASSPLVLFNGIPVVVRPGTQASGLAGIGGALQFDDGFYLRLQASYDSIGVYGLNVWSGRIRAGITF